MTSIKFTESELEQILLMLNFEDCQFSFFNSGSTFLVFRGPGIYSQSQISFRGESMQLPSIAATTIGSFPRPTWLAQTDRSRAIFRLEGAALKEAQDDATALSIRTQERIGLDLLSDGEQRRTGFINHILAAFNGIDLVHEGEKQIYRRRELPRWVPRITGKISRRSPAIVDDLRFAKTQTTSRSKWTCRGQ